MNTPQINDGGPAFPVLSYEYKASGDLHPSPTMQSGMTLRDWFAGMSLNGMRSSKFQRRSEDCPLSSEDISCLAYQDADAMISQRNKV